MTRNRLLVLVPFIAALGACGGRSSLRPVTYDGGIRSTDTGTLGDGRRDGTQLDGPRDGIRNDVALDGPRDGVRTDGPLDGLRLDAGSLDARGDVPLATDLRDAATDVARTLTRIEATPTATTIVVGVPYTALVVTGIYSDGSTANLTTSASLSSSDTSIVQVNGRTLSGQRPGTATITVSASGRTTTVRITVTSSALQSITVDNVSTVIVGQAILVTATGIFADGTKQDVTGQATWASSNPLVAIVSLDPSGKEKVLGLTAGTATLSAALQGITGTASVTVTASPMVRIEVTPTQPILQRGVTQNFQATATFADNTASDITQQATWTTSDAAIASVAKSATGVRVTALEAGSATITATLGTLQGSTNVTVTAPTLRSLTVTPGIWDANVGTTQSFTAQATYSDGTSADATLSATWSSSSPNIVSVSNAPGQQGFATALLAGAAQIQATLAGVSGLAEVKVGTSPLVSLAITPNPAPLVLGLKVQLTATGTYLNGTTQDLTTQAAWSVADAAIASVSNATGSAGQATGLGLGSTSVSATFSGITGTATVTVAQTKLASITVAPATSSVSAGSTQAYTATGNYDNGSAVDLTTQATWSSSNIAVAQISNATGSRGLATSLIAGTTTISAQMGEVAGTATLTVTAPQLSSITITPTDATVAVRGTQSFTVRAVYRNGTTTVVTNQSAFTSSNTQVATITTTGGGGGGGGGGRGVATGIGAGTTTITATYQGLTDTATLTVNAAVTLVGFTVSPTNPPAILVGANQQFQANAIYSDGSTQGVTGSTNWTTSDAQVASISNGGRGGGRGQATGIGAGTATITATYNGFTDTATITVRDPQPTGLVITPASASIRVNQTQGFAAILTLEDGTTRTVTNNASWTSSSPEVASVTSSGGGGGGGGGGGRGVATGIGPGTATLTATYSGFTDTATLTVTAATPKQLVVTPAVASLSVGQTLAFTATVVFDDNTTSVVTGQSTWSSSAPDIAIITSGGGGGGGGGGNRGTATALAVGTTTLTATYVGLSATAVLTVKDPAVTYVQVTPVNPTLPINGTTQFTATAVFADNTTRNVTGLATWSSSNATVALVSSTGGNRGQATAVAAGSATITATYEGFSGASLLTVSASVLSLNIAPAVATTVLGLPVAFTATATLSNNAVITVTNAASWISSDPTVATILSSGGNAGLATPLKAGTVTITATYLGVPATATLTVSAATLSSLVIAPSPVTLPAGTSAQLTVTGLYSDGSSQVLTNNATWLSANPSTAVVSNAAGSRGLLTGLANGTTTVSAIFQGITGTAPVTVGTSP